jgi:hypothetical protein
MSQIIIIGSVVPSVCHGCKKGFQCLEDESLTPLVADLSEALELPRELSTKLNPAEINYVNLAKELPNLDRKPDSVEFLWTTAHEEIGAFCDKHCNGHQRPP